MGEIKVTQKIGWAFATEMLALLLHSPATRENEQFSPQPPSSEGSQGAWEAERAYPVWMPTLCFENWCTGFW